MDLFIVKERLKLMLWLLGFVAVVATTFCIVGHFEAEPINATQLMAGTLATGGIILGWLSLLVWFLFARRKLANGPPPRYSPRKQIPWGLIKLLFLITTVAALAVTVHHLARPEETPFTLLRAGDLDALQTLLREHPELIDVPEAQNKLTLLQVALDNENTAAAEFLFSSGATFDPDSTLILPIENLSMLKLLLKHGAKPDVLDPHGLAPLHGAAASGNVDAIKLLLQYGASRATRTSDYLTPLLVAVTENQTAALVVLLEADADPNKFNKQNNTALHKAVFNNNPEIVKILLSNGADQNNFNVRGMAPVHIAALNGYNEILELLLDLPGMVHLESTHNETPFDFALRRRTFKTAQLLLSRGAEIDRIRSNGLTALHTAVKNKEMLIAEFLISEGANAHIDTFDKQTAYELMKKQGLNALVSMVDRRDQPEPEKSE